MRVSLGLEQARLLLLLRLVLLVLGLQVLLVLLLVLLLLVLLQHFPAQRTRAAEKCCRRCVLSTPPLVTVPLRRQLPTPSDQHPALALRHVASRATDAAVAVEKQSQKDGSKMGTRSPSGWRVCCVAVGLSV